MQPFNDFAMLRRVIEIVLAVAIRPQYEYVGPVRAFSLTTKKTSRKQHWCKLSLKQWRRQGGVHRVQVHPPPKMSRKKSFSVWVHKKWWQLGFLIFPFAIIV